ncbi:MAG: deacylase [Rhodospirillaceae bacterium]|nr:deacylase [Rhodospirillaceae bacterium]HAA92550.1 acyloxyacyl hydrolase [Rhodospirillaceae bacterium]
MRYKLSTCAIPNCPYDAEKITGASGILALLTLKKRVLAATALVLGRGAAVLLAFWLAIAPAAAGNKDPAFIKLGGGDIGSCCADRDQAGVFSIEYRAGPDLELLHIRPSLGVFGTTDASIYGWFGLSGDIFFGRRIVLTLGSAVGFYLDGEGQDLGHVLEFRSGAEIAWRFDNRARLGIGVTHLSNANIADKNPGTETVMLIYSHPLKSLFSDKK